MAVKSTWGVAILPACVFMLAGSAQAIEFIDFDGLEVRAEGTASLTEEFMDHPSYPAHPELDISSQSLYSGNIQFSRIETGESIDAYRIDWETNRVEFWEEGESGLYLYRTHEYLPSGLSAASPFQTYLRARQAHDSDEYQVVEETPSRVTIAADTVMRGGVPNKYHYRFELDGGRITKITYYSITDYSSQAGPEFAAFYSPVWETSYSDYEDQFPRSVRTVTFDFIEGDTSPREVRIYTLGITSIEDYGRQERRIEELTSDLTPLDQPEIPEPEVDTAQLPDNPLANSSRWLLLAGGIVIVLGAGWVVLQKRSS